MSKVDGALASCMLLSHCDCCMEGSVRGYAILRCGKTILIQAKKNDASVCVCVHRPHAG